MERVGQQRLRVKRTSTSKSDSSFCLRDGVEVCDLLELKLCSASCTFLPVTEFTRCVPLLTALGICILRIRASARFFEFITIFQEKHAAAQQERAIFSVVNLYVVLKRYNR